ncbi:hypothetical protein BH11PSE12_BH11PSE12_23350 [soil metagenome]
MWRCQVHHCYRDYFFSLLLSLLLAVTALTPALVTSIAVPTTALPTLIVVETAASAMAMTVQAQRDKLHSRSAIRNIQVRTVAILEVNYR